MEFNNNNPIDHHKLPDEIIERVQNFINRLNSAREFLEQNDPQLLEQLDNELNEHLRGIDRSDWTYRTYRFNEEQMNLRRSLVIEINVIGETLAGHDHIRD